MWVRFPLLAPNALYRSDRLNMWLYKLINDLNHTHCSWSGGHVNLSTGWLETVYGCHAYPKKTPNTRGGDYQTPSVKSWCTTVWYESYVIVSQRHTAESDRIELSVSGARKLYLPLEVPRQEVLYVLVVQFCKNAERMRLVGDQFSTPEVPMPNHWSGG